MVNINGFLFLRRGNYLFEKHLSKYCIRAYREIYVGVGEAFEAVLTDTSNNETRVYGNIGSPRDDFGSRGCEKPAGNFTAKIDKLTRQNLAPRAVEIDSFKG